MVGSECSEPCKYAILQFGVHQSAWLINMLHLTSSDVDGNACYDKCVHGHMKGFVGVNAIPWWFLFQIKL